MNSKIFLAFPIIVVLIVFMSLDQSAGGTFLGVNGKIAFHSDRDGNFEIYSMNSDGTGQTRLTTNTDLDAEPSWSPDGTMIAFYSNRDGNDEIYIMNSDGTGQTRLTTNTFTDREPSWSPDGTMIAFHTDRDADFEVYTMTSAGFSQTRLTTNAAFDGFPSWSPDGTMIAFSSNRDANNEIYTMTSTGASPTNLSNNGASDESPSWSPDGTMIAFESTRDGNNEIYTMTSAGLSQTRLTTDLSTDGEPSWSPDGTMIAFHAFRNGNGEIYTMTSAGLSQTRLTINAAADTSPDWGTDTTPPVVTHMITGTQGDNGWYKDGDVTVTWTIVDPESGFLVSGCGTQVVSDDTSPAGIDLLCSATSAGGTTDDDVNIKRDTEAPSTTATPSGTLGNNGWYTSESVSVGLAATDPTPGSGVASITYTLDANLPVTVSDDTATVPINGEGTHTLSYFATDNAGDPIETATELEIKIDSVKPTGTLIINNLAASTTTRAVTIDGTCFDATSGCAFMTIAEDGVLDTESPETAANFVDRAASTTSGRGVKAMVMQLEDGAGLVSDPNPSDTINLDAVVEDVVASNHVPLWGLDNVHVTATVRNALDSDQLRIALGSPTVTVAIPNGDVVVAETDHTYDRPSVDPNSHHVVGTIVDSVGAEITTNTDGSLLSDDDPTNVVAQRHVTSLSATVNSRFFLGNTFSVVDTLFDVSAGKHVDASKNIVFSNTGAFGLSSVSTGGIRITSPSTMTIESVGGVDVLRVLMNTDIERTSPTTPPEIVDIYFKGLIGGSPLVLEVTPAGSDPEELSLTIAPGDQFAHLVYADGIDKIRILSIPGGALTIDISRIETQNGNYDTVHNIVDFSDIVLGIDTLQPGKYSAVDTLTSAGGKTLDVNFAGDLDFVGSSTTTSFTVAPRPDTGSGGFGGDATILPDGGVGISPTSCSGTYSGDPAPLDFDNDDDFLCDTWEGGTSGTGIPIGTSATDKYLLSGSDPMKKDIYIESDYMGEHLPNPDSISDVIGVFEASTADITIHHDNGDSIPHLAAIGAWVDSDYTYGNDFATIKNVYFATPDERPSLDASLYSQAISGTGTSKTLTVSGLEITTPTSTQTGGITNGKVVIKIDMTLTTASKVTKGTPTIPSSGAGAPEAGVTITGITAAVTKATTVNTAKTVTITISYRTDLPQASPLSIGTVSLPLTFTTSQTGNPTLTRVPGTPTISSDLRDAKAQAYRYIAWVHSIGPCGPSGQAELRGNDAIIALGCNFDASAAEPGLPTLDGAGKRNTVGTRQEQSGTLMHELGHLLNLQHGGPRNPVASFNSPYADTPINCKPNYPSVMSYPRQIPGYLVVDAGWLLDYSNGGLSGIDEGVLVEDDTDGLGSAFGSGEIVWATPSSAVPQTFLTGPANGPDINWDGDSGIDAGTVSVDVNNFNIVGCGSSQPEVGIPYPYLDYNDWVDLDLNLRALTFGQFDGFYDSNSAECGTNCSTAITYASSLFFGFSPPPELRTGNAEVNSGQSVVFKAPIFESNGMDLIRDLATAPNSLTFSYSRVDGNPSYTTIVCTNTPDGKPILDTSINAYKCVWKTTTSAGKPLLTGTYKIKVVFDGPGVGDSEFVLTDDTPTTPTNPHNLPYVDPDTQKVVTAQLQLIKPKK